METLDFNALAFDACMWPTHGGPGVLAESCQQLSAMLPSVQSKVRMLPELAVAASMLQPQLSHSPSASHAAAMGKS